MSPLSIVDMSIVHRVLYMYRGPNAIMSSVFTIIRDTIYHLTQVCRLINLSCARWGAYKKKTNGIFSCIFAHKMGRFTRYVIFG
jgi:hypothetical protein